MQESLFLHTLSLILSDRYKVRVEVALNDSGDQD